MAGIINVLHGIQKLFLNVIHPVLMCLLRMGTYCLPIGWIIARARKGCLAVRRDIDGSMITEGGFTFFQYDAIIHAFGNWATCEGEGTLAVANSVVEDGLASATFETDYLDNLILLDVVKVDFNDGFCSQERGEHGSSNGHAG